MKKNLLIVWSLTIVIATTASAAAQSTNRDRATPLVSSELRGDLEGHGHESFYSFTAGPGELTITVDVKSSEGTLAMPFELLSANGADPLLCCEYAQADAPSETGRAVKSITLRRRQTIILHLTENSYGRGTFRIRLSGPVVFAEIPGGSVGGEGLGRDNGRNRMGMPTTGTLRIRMRDGSTKEIDLSLVQTVSVQP